MAFAALAVSATLGCAGKAWEAISRPHVADVQLSEAETAELEKARATGSSVSLPKADAEAAWGRAQYWVSKNSTMKVQTASDFLLVTYNPIEWYPKPQYGYQVNRVPIGENVTFEVECLYASKYVPTADRPYDPRYQSPPRAQQTPPRVVERMQKDCAINAAIAAHFIKTGEALCPRCIAN
jgi:hypothetical protein